MRLGMTSTLLSVLLLGALGAASPAALPDRPLTLEDCLRLAFVYSPTLQIAEQEVVTAQAGVQRQISRYLPTADFLGTWGPTGGSSFIQTSTGSTLVVSGVEQHKDTELLLSQTFWEAGRREALEEARHGLAASRARNASTQQDLVLSIAGRYYDALAAQDLVGVSEAALAAARDQQKLVEARISVGEGAPVDAAPAEAEVANAELTLVQTENAAAVARAALKSEMGVQPTYDLQLAPAGAPPGAETLPSLESAVATALARRPEMASARASVAGAEDVLRIARIRQNGVFALSGQYDGGITGVKEHANSWAVLLSVTGFLFDGGALRADVAAARANLCIVQAQQQQVANGIGLEVETALLDVTTARKSVEAAAKAVASAEARLAAAVGKYRAGTGIFVEISDAQQALTRAQAQQVAAVYDNQKAMVALRRAMGEPPVPSSEATP
jgi:outer membrane protein